MLFRGKERAKMLSKIVALASTLLNFWPWALAGYPFRCSLTSPCIELQIALAASIMMLVY